MPVELQYILFFCTNSDVAHRDKKKTTTLAWFYYSKADGTKWDMGADQLNDLHVANLTTPLHWSNVNPDTQTEYAWHQTGWWPVCFRTNHLDMQLPPAPKLFLSPGRGHPFIWGLQIKQVSWLINLTDRAYCGHVCPKENLIASCPDGWLFYCSLIRCSIMDHIEPTW